MNFNLENKKVFITGSTSGIGLEIARKLDQYGCKVAINSRHEINLEKFRKNFNNPIQFIKGDMSNDIDSKKAIHHFVQSFGSIDILICNVGTGKSSAPCTESFDDWYKSISMNLLSATNPISASLKYLEMTSGVITCVSSICAQKMIEGAPLTYASSKAALERYVINSSFYFAKKNIRINAVAPGNVIFPGSVWEKKSLEDPNKINEMLRQKVPLNKFVTTEDISEAVAFLSSPLSQSTTGQVINIDAGQTVA